MVQGNDKGAPTPEGGAAEGAEGEASAKKKPPLMVLIAAGVGALVVLGGGGVGAMMFLGKKPPAEASAAKEHAKKEKKEGGHGEGGKEGAAKTVGQIAEGPDGVVFYTLPDLVVNIQAADNRPTFLKLKLAFELPDESVADALEPNAPRLADMLQTFLRELRPEDLSGSQGSYQLRMEILRRVNLVIAPAKVNAVLIQEMLIQ
jgi:flagellar FliL protein